MFAYDSQTAQFWNYPLCYWQHLSLFHSRAVHVYSIYKVEQSERDLHLHGNYAYRRIYFLVEGETSGFVVKER